MKLDAWLRAPHSDRERLQVVAGLCAAVEAAQGQGRTRGVLDPAGIEVDASGQCRLGPETSALGSSYIAPELRGGESTSKSDVYAAGLLFYEVLTGRSPLRPEPRRPLKELQPSLPQDLADAVNACLEEDVDWRPPDLSFVLALARRDAGPAAPRAQPGPRPPIRRSPPPAILRTTTRPQRSAPGRLPVMLVAAVLAVAAGTWLWMSVVHPRPSTPGSGVRPSAPTPTTVVESTPPPDLTLAGTPPPSRRESEPSPPASPSARPTAAPSTAARPAPSPTTASATVVPAAVTPSPPSMGDALAPEAAPAPSTLPSAPPITPPARSEPAPLGPASITAVSPFRLRAGALQALDVHGTGLHPDLHVRITLPKRREPVAGINVTRSLLRSPTLMVVSVQIEPEVRAGKYALSLVGPDGTESNAFVVEVGVR
jgi:Quinohemoprotein amine dehydrogenase, alpha subunit domain III